MTDRILVVAAHPDDEVLGCGGTIIKHRSQGDEVMVVVLADGVTSRDTVPQHSLQRRQQCVSALRLLGVKQWGFGDWPDNKLDTVPRLHLVKDIEQAIRLFQPTVIYTHHGSDCNIDHRTVNDAVIVACRPQPGSTVKRLLFFEVPSSSEYQAGRAAFQPNWFVPIGETLARKLVAMREYREEVRDAPHPRSIQAVCALAQWRGAMIGESAAEAFVMARGIC